MKGITQAVETKEAAVAKREIAVTTMEINLQERMQHHQTTVKALRSEKMEGEAANIASVAALMSTQDLRKAVFVAELRESFETGSTSAMQRLVQHLVDGKGVKDGKDSMGPRSGWDLRAAVTGALSGLAEPASLVMEIVTANKCFPAHKTGGNSAQQNSARKGVSILLECLTAIEAEVSSELKAEACTTLAAWEGGMHPTRPDGMDCFALVMLVTAYGLQAEAEQGVLMSCVKELTSRKQLHDIVTKLGMTERVPELVAALLEDDKLTEAVNVVVAFELTESHAPRQMMEDMAGKVQAEEDKPKQLTGIKQLMRCMKQHAAELDAEGREHMEALAAPLKAKMATLQPAAKKRPAASAPSPRGGKQLKGVGGQRVADPAKYRPQRQKAMGQQAMGQQTMGNPMYMQVPMQGSYAHNGSGLARAMLQDTTHQYTGLAQQLNMGATLPMRYF